MTPTRLDIAIVGSGSGGPASAALLAKQGHRVSLFEQSPRELPVGAGFLLQPSGLAVLHEIGCLEQLLPKVAKVERLRCVAPSGKALLDLNYKEIGAGLFGAGTHRPTLLRVLLRRCRELGVLEFWGHRVLGIELDEGCRVSLRFDDRQPKRPFDLVVVSDGARSGIRSQLGIPYRANQYPWGALWFIGERDDAFDRETLWQSVNSTTRLAGFLPTGTEDDLLSLFWSIRLDRIAETRARPLDEWKRQVMRLAPQAEEFLQQIQSHDQLQVARYMDVRMRRFHKGRVVLVGDSAHALSPQLGQGVNLALRDAARLSACLGRYPLEIALRRYSRDARRQLNFYQVATRWLTPFFQSDHRALGLTRDLLFPLTQQSRWMRKEMVLSMAGLKTGLFTHSQPEACCFREELSSKAP